MRSRPTRSSTSQCCWATTLRWSARSARAPPTTAVGGRRRFRRLARGGGLGRRFGRRRSGGARRGRDGSLRGRRHVSLAGLGRRDSRHRRSDRGRGCLHRCLRLARRRLRLDRGACVTAGAGASAGACGAASTGSGADTSGSGATTVVVSPLSSPGWARAGAIPPVSAVSEITMPDRQNGNDATLRAKFEGCTHVYRLLQS